MHWHQKAMKTIYCTLPQPLPLKGGELYSSPLVGEGQGEGGSFHCEPLEPAMLAARSTANLQRVTESSSPARKRCGMPERPTWAPTRAPVSMARAWFWPPPLTWDKPQDSMPAKKARF